MKFTYSQTPLDGLYLHFITTVHTILHITNFFLELTSQRTSETIQSYFYRNADTSFIRHR